MLRKLAHMRERLDARPAPRRPKVEHHHLALQVGERMETVARGPREMQFRRGLADEFGLQDFCLLHFADELDVADGTARGFAARVVRLHAFELGKRPGGVLEDLQRESRLRKSDLCHVFGFVAGVFGEQRVEGRGLVGKFSGLLGAGLDFCADAGLERLEVGGGGRNRRGGGCRCGLGEHGERQDGGDDEAGESGGDFHQGSVGHGRELGAARRLPPVETPPRPCGVSLLSAGGRRHGGGRRSRNGRCAASPTLPRRPRDCRRARGSLG